MLLKMNATTLRHLLRRVSRATHRRCTVNVLACVRLQAFPNNNLQAECTDLERHYIENAACEVHTPGILITPAAQLITALQHFSGDVEISLQPSNGGQTCVITSGRATIKLQNFAQEDWPSRQDHPQTGAFEIPAHQLLKMFGAVVHAISTEETRYYLNGVYLHHHAAGILRAVATDGHRMAISEMPTIEGAEKIAGIIPRNVVADARAILNGAATARIAYGPTHLSITAGPLTMECKLIDGTFPDYERVIPRSEAAATWQFCPRQTAASVALVRMGTRGAAVKLEAAGKAITLSGSYLHDGVFASVDQPATICGKQITLGVQARYLSDLLTVCHGTVQIDVIDASAPLEISDSLAPQNLFVLMPMRV